MTNGAHPGYQPAFRRHVAYASPGLAGQNQSTFAPAYGRPASQSQWHPVYNFPSNLPAPVPSPPPANYSYYPAVSYHFGSAYPNSVVQPSYPGPPAAMPMYIPQVAPAVYPVAGTEITQFTGLTVSPRGLEAILIAILILVALDLVLVRPHKGN